MVSVSPPRVRGDTVIARTVAAGCERNDGKPQNPARCRGGREMSEEMLTTLIVENLCEFTEMLQGPNVPSWCYDMDCDGDVDMADWLKAVEQIERKAGQ